MREEKGLEQNDTVSELGFWRFLRAKYKERYQEEFE